MLEAMGDLLTVVLPPSCSSSVFYCSSHLNHSIFHDPLFYFPEYSALAEEMCAWMRNISIEEDLQMVIIQKFIPHVDDRLCTMECAIWMKDASS